MKAKIVLRNLPADVTQLIEERAASDNIDHEKAILAILQQAAIESAVEHDIELMKSSWLPDEVEDVSRAAFCLHLYCCGQPVNRSTHHD
jgi:hypothetical protein